MLDREAVWFGEQLRLRSDAELFPLLNIGSQTLSFRTVEQPFIDGHLFAPLRARGGRVVHTDLQAAEGVDVVGDLTDPAFQGRLRGERFRSVICSNLLEHVPNREEVARIVVEVLEPGGFLFLSCPYRYPYHPDPIDTLYRPTPSELAAIHPNTRVVDEAVLKCGTYSRELGKRFLANPIGLTWRVGVGAVQSLTEGPRKPVPQTSYVLPKAPSGAVGRLLPWLFKQFEASCLVLRKEE